MSSGYLSYGFSYTSSIGKQNEYYGITTNLGCLRKYKMSYLMLNCSMRFDAISVERVAVKQRSAMVNVLVPAAYPVSLINSLTQVKTSCILVIISSSIFDATPKRSRY